MTTRPHNKWLLLAGACALAAACANSSPTNEDDQELRPLGERMEARSIAQAPDFVQAFDPEQERRLQDEPASAHGFTGQTGEDAPRCQVKFFNETRWKVRIYLEKRYLGTVFPLESSEVALRAGERNVQAWADADQRSTQGNPEGGTQWKRVFTCQPEEQDQWYLYEPND